jgi:hypothetical protein
LSIYILCTVSGQQKEIRTVSDFTGIEASGAFDISITKGNRTTLSIEADEKIMPYIVSEVRGNVLHLYIADNDIKNIKAPRAYIVMKNLDAVNLSGACKISSNDRFAPDRFNADLSGASGLNLQINTKQLEINASGASNINLNTKASEQANIDISGASKLKIQLNTPKSTFHISGASNTELTGSADNVEIDISGTSNVDAPDFMVKSMVVEASGVSKATIYSSNSLKVNSSGFSKINYKGSPSITEFNTGNSSKIKKIN